jgi:ABC-type sugar transport system ATPase subunit
MVFQSYALYPHMTARANMEFGLKVAGLNPQEIAARVAEGARILQLEEYLDRKPGQLSGGQRQRVAIGRAIVKKPNVFLFDEPLSNLDAGLRIQMRVELENLHAALGATMIYVTHDQVEAMTMADKIVVLNGGRVEQVGPPLDLYHAPKTRFVAGFIGAPSMNFLPVTIAAAGGETAHVRYGDDTVVTVPGLRPGAPVGAELTLGIRPEHLAIEHPGPSGIPARIIVVEALGGESYIHADTQEGHRLVIKVKGDAAVRRGEPITVGLESRCCHLFGADGAAVPRVPV